MNVNAATILLMCMLAVSVIAFVVMGAKQSRRARWLAQKAGQENLRFSREDLFDVPRRYADFAPISSGHSPKAHNVIYGRKEGLGIRAFDFRCEVGHGTQRMTRRYCVIVLETELDMPSLVLWNDMDRQLAPLEITPQSPRSGCWSFTGPPEAAKVIAEKCASLADQGVSIQTRGPILTLCLPLQKHGHNYIAHIYPAIAAAGALAEFIGSPWPRQAGVSDSSPFPKANVENPPLS